jgi:hypothetical protein
MRDNTTRRLATDRRSAAALRAATLLVSWQKPGKETRRGNLVSVTSPLPHLLCTTPLTFWLQCTVFGSNQSDHVVLIHLALLDFRKLSVVLETFISLLPSLLTVLTSFLIVIFLCPLFPKADLRFRECMLNKAWKNLQRKTPLTNEHRKFTMSVETYTIAAIEQGGAVRLRRTNQPWNFRLVGWYGFKPPNPFRRARQPPRRQRRKPLQQRRQHRKRKPHPHNQQREGQQREDQAVKKIDEIVVIISLV